MQRLLAILGLVIIAALLLWLQTNRGPSYQIDDCAAPKLVPALRRLQECAPALYQFVASQPTRFGCSSDNLPFVQGHSVLLPTTLSVPQLSAEANQYLLMVTAVHSSRLAWQSELTTQWTIQQRAADAYRFGEDLFRQCPTTDPQGVGMIRTLAERWAQAPE